MTLITATRLAALRKPLPGESAAYGTLRQDLLRDEIELQRHIDRVAENGSRFPTVRSSRRIIFSRT